MKPILEEVVPRIEGMRSLFYADYDNRPPLHLSDIMSTKGHFILLKNLTTRREFDDIFLSLLRGGRIYNYYDCGR